MFSEPRPVRVEGQRRWRRPHTRQELWRALGAGSLWGIALPLSLLPRNTFFSPSHLLFILLYVRAVAPMKTAVAPCCSPDEDALCCLQRAAWLNSNSVRHRGRLSATAASEEAEREEPQPCLALQLVRKLCLACLSLASGIIKTSDLFFNSLFSEKGKAALMEAFKSGAGFPCFVRQRGFL